MSENVNKPVNIAPQTVESFDVEPDEEATPSPRGLGVLSRDIEVAATQLVKYTRARARLAGGDSAGDAPINILEYRVGDLVVKSGQLPTSVNELVTEAVLSHIEGRIFTIWGTISELSNAANALIDKKTAGEKQ